MKASNKNYLAPFAYISLFVKMAKKSENVRYGLQKCVNVNFGYIFTAKNKPAGI
jgi:hypothetical protein